MIENLKGRSVGIAASLLLLALLVTLWGAPFSGGPPLFPPAGAQVDAGAYAAALAENVAPWRPLAALSFRAQAALGLGGARELRLANLFLYFLAAAALFLLIRRVSSMRGAAAGRATRAALAGAALWAAHPLNQGAVLWAAQRGTLLAGAFGLLSLWAYARRRDAAGGRGWGALALLFYLLALSAGEAALALALVAPLLDYLLFDQKEPGGTSWKRRLAFWWAPALVSGVAYFLAAHFDSYEPSAGTANIWLTHLATLPRALLAEASLALLPLPGRLSLTGPLPEGGFWTLPSLLALGLVAGAAGWAWRERRRRPSLAFTLAAFLVAGTAATLPHPFEPVAGYRLCLPLALVVLGFSTAWASAASSAMTKAAAAAALAAGALFLAVSLYRGPLWNDSAKLAGEWIKKNPNSGLARLVRGDLEVAGSDGAAALLDYQKAAELRLGDPAGALRLGRLLTDARRPDQAEKVFRETLAARPGSFELNLALADLLARTGRAGESLAVYQDAANLAGGEKRVKALLGLAAAALRNNGVPTARQALELADRIEPGRPDILVEMGRCEFQVGGSKAALPLYEKALARNPDYVPALYEAARAFLVEKKSEEAEGYLKRVLTVDPENEAALNDLGNVYLSRGEKERARLFFENAAKGPPAAASRAHFNLGVLDRKAEHFEDAVAHYREAIRLAPGFLPARYDLAVALAGVENFCEAVRAMDEYLDLAADDSREQGWAARGRKALEEWRIGCADPEALKKKKADEAAERTNKLRRKMEEAARKAVRERRGGR